MSIYAVLCFVQCLLRFVKCISTCVAALGVRLHSTWPSKKGISVPGCGQIVDRLLHFITSLQLSADMLMWPCERQTTTNWVQSFVLYPHSPPARSHVGCCRVYDVSKGHSFYGPGRSYHRYEAPPRVQTNIDSVVINSVVFYSVFYSVFCSLLSIKSSSPSHSSTDTHPPVNDSLQSLTDTHLPVNDSLQSLPLTPTHLSTTLFNLSLTPTYLSTILFNLFHSNPPTCPTHDTSRYVGRDATRSYATGCTRPECLVSSLVGCSEQQKQEARRWLELYEHHDK